MLRVRGLSAALICLGLVGAAAAQAKKDAKPAIDKAKLVGTWVFAKGEGWPSGSTFEFTKDGKATFKIDLNGKTISVDGVYKVDGDKLTMTMKSPASGKDETGTPTIKTLTDEKLLWVDEKGKEAEFKRVPKK